MASWLFDETLLFHVICKFTEDALNALTQVIKDTEQELLSNTIGPQDKKVLKLNGDNNL